MVLAFSANSIQVIQDVVAKVEEEGVTREDAVGRIKMLNGQVELAIIKLLQTRIFKPRLRMVKSQEPQER